MDALVTYVRGIDVESFILGNAFAVGCVVLGVSLVIYFWAIVASANNHERRF